METTFNIGLNNNPFNSIQARSIVQDILLEHAVINFDYDYVMGEFNGNQEPTLVCKFESTITEQRMNEIVTALTLIMTQESIAIKTGDKGKLIFNPSYEGDEYEFSDEYFINL